MVSWSWWLGCCGLWVTWVVGFVGCCWVVEWSTSSNMVMDRDGIRVVGYGF